MMDSSHAPAGEPSRPLAPPIQPARRRKNHRAGKKKKSRRKSFAAPSEEVVQGSLTTGALDETRQGFYARPNRNNSNTSIDSEVLLDHRAQQAFLRPRRPSTMNAGSFQPQYTTPQAGSRLKSMVPEDSDDENPPATPWDERAPLLTGSSLFHRAETFAGYGANDANRRTSSRTSSRRRFPATPGATNDGYNVNYPPSVPGSPTLGPSDRLDMSFGDVMMRDDLGSISGSRSPTRGGENESRGGAGFPPSLERRHTVAMDAETDVCFPQEGLSEMAEEDMGSRDPMANKARRARRHTKWPDLAHLENWSRLEKEGRSEGRRAKKLTEPRLINGRLRPTHRGWYQAEEDAPYRFTYFNEDFQSTIHSQTISELVQPGTTFKELFVPEPPLLYSDSEEEDDDSPDLGLHHTYTGQNGDSHGPTRQPSLVTATQPYSDTRKESSQPFIGHAAPTLFPKQDQEERAPRLGMSPAQASIKSPRGPMSPPPPKEEREPEYGERPVWWLDVYSPTEAEMKVLSKAFGIHPLTAEDIMVQEQREKVELFKNYYFVNYRTFDQDQSSENFLEPVNMYVVVFREGVLSFHFSLTPHPANVRRRIRQLRDYMILSSDWISYAIIDDITDVFVPLIQNIEDEVDDIDDAILQLHSSDDKSDSTWRGRGGDNEKSEMGDTSSAEAGRDMLRRVGDCRKRVMSLYRLLGNKADVIKGFAKRCNEHWEVAPRSEIGLYLGDIQDHIVTMTSNLSHYEKILARSHGNYLAQINIRMNEKQEQTADVLGRLTVLGTIVLPMNIITGLWGMNVWVPGQDSEGDLMWFVAITAGLLFFGLGCFLVAKRVYGIV